MNSPESTPAKAPKRTGRRARKAAARGAEATTAAAPAAAPTLAIPAATQPAYLGRAAHLRTRKERSEAGRALRVTCPREAHAGFKAAATRPDPVDLLIASSVGRIPHLVPIRYGRMLASPFAFYRGAAAIMASDLSTTPSTGLILQACGDCHLVNFGAFATPERRIIFDINDFDETHPAPWEWDLKRLAASFVIASRHNGHKPADCRAAAAAVVTNYAEKLVELAALPTLEAWYAYLDYEALVELTEDQELKRRRKKVLQKAMSHDASAEFVKLAHLQDGLPRIRDMPPLIFHPEDWREPGFAEGVRDSVARYRDSLSAERRVLFDRYEVADVAIKVVGVGSVGTLCAVMLLFAAEDDMLFLQIKEARPSVLAPFVKASGFASNGERVVFGQRLMQAASDVFLGHAIGAQGTHLYVRQLRDVKIKPMVEIFTAQNMQGFARNTGWALARAHARSGDPALVAGYIGKGDAFADAVAEFAVDYADQNQRDHAALLAAVRAGRIDATMEGE
jgi:uncharacterized protein (DUF2252 family)